MHGSVATITDEARTQDSKVWDPESDGESPQIPIPIFVAVSADTVQKTGRDGKEFLILAGLRAEDQAFAEPLKSHLQKLMGRIEPKAPLHLAADGPSEGLVKTSTQLLPLEEEIIQHLMQLRNVGGTASSTQAKSGKQGVAVGFIPKLLLLLLAATAGSGAYIYFVHPARLDGTASENHKGEGAGTLPTKVSKNTPITEFFEKGDNAEWRILAKLTNLTQQDLENDERLFIDWGTTMLWEITCKDDSRHTVGEVISELESLSATNAGKSFVGHLPAQNVSEERRLDTFIRNQLKDPNNEGLQEFVNKFFEDKPQGARPYLDQLQKALRDFADKKSATSDEVVGSWCKNIKSLPLAPQLKGYSIQFITPMDFTRWKVMGEILQDDKWSQLLPHDEVWSNWSKMQWPERLEHWKVAATSVSLEGETLGLLCGSISRISPSSQ